MHVCRSVCVYKHRHLYAYVCAIVRVEVQGRVYVCVRLSVRVRVIARFSLYVYVSLYVRGHVDTRGRVDVQHRCPRFNGSLQVLKRK